MTNERFEEIIAMMVDPGNRVTLIDHTDHLTANYFIQKSVEITRMKDTLTRISEEIELEMLVRDKELTELQEYMNLSIEDFITTFSVEEVEGMDANARKALARTKSEKRWVEQQNALAIAQGKSPPERPLRQEIVYRENLIKGFKTVLKLIESRRSELSRLDSTLRMQLHALDAEKLAINYGRNGNRVSPPIPSSGTPNHSLPPDDRSTLVGGTPFEELLET
jgi:hypothetical protein